MAKTKQTRRKAPEPLPATKRTQLQAWVDKQGHGAQSLLMHLTGLRWQTVHDLVERKRNAKLPTAKLIEQATEGVVHWEPLLVNRLPKDDLQAAS